MRAVVLIDNISDSSLTAEWGLAIHIEWNGKKILLDTGTTGAFVRNAAALGIPLSEVDCGVLSHAHFDHANGMRAFFAENRIAPFYLREGTKENCYGRKFGFLHYNGIRRGTLHAFADRIVFASGLYTIFPGAYLLPHSTPSLGEIGKHAGMYRRSGLRLTPDDFSHEQSLVLETDRGLAVFSSCSHAGADNILHEVREAFPEKEICAMIGGFHLFSSTDEEVRAFADRVAATGIGRLVTGHCTGERAYSILKERLGDRIGQLRCGYTLEL